MSIRWSAVFVLMIAVPVVEAQQGPDVIVGDLWGVGRAGTVNGVTGYSIATDSCNIGTENLPWFAFSNEHPLIAQNLYRLKDGRFEQLGMSWVKHGFGALAEATCSPNCQDPGNTNFLGVNCSDPYTTGLNADQDGFDGVQAIFWCGQAAACGGLGPRSDVNPDTGDYPWPYTSQGLSGDAIYKRLQVRNDDLDPALNSGALYFAEGHYVTAADALAGNQDNNVSYRPVTVGTFVSGGWNLSLTGQTQREEPAIMAWEANVQGVQTRSIDIPNEGRLILASRCTDNGDSTWHYEYALYNMNSHRAVGSYSVPVTSDVTLSNTEFRDVDHHSGEPYATTDWEVKVESGQVEWATDPFQLDPDANALRWGTMFNFRFDADVAPQPVGVQIGLFRPGTPASVVTDACGPCSDEDLDGVCVTLDNCPVDSNPGQEDPDLDLFGDPCDNCPSNFNPAQLDVDTDDTGDLCDLDDGLLFFTDHQVDQIDWQDETVYDRFNVYRGVLSVLRAGGAYTQFPDEPDAARFCGLASPSLNDTFVPASGEATFYLVTGFVGTDESGLGEDSAGNPRPNTHSCFR